MRRVEDKDDITLDNFEDDSTVIQQVDFEVTSTKFDGSQTSFFINNNNDPFATSITIENPLEKIIRKYALIQEDDLDKLIKEKRLKMNQLIESYVVNVDKLYKVLSVEFNMRYYDNMDNLINHIDDELIDLATQKRLGVLVVLLKSREEDSEYFILIDDPFDYELKDYIKNLIDTPVKINFALAKKDLIKKIILKYIKDGDIKLQFSLDNTSNIKILSQSEIEEIEYNIENDVPIIPLVNYIILNAHELRVSDIHIEPTEEHMVVRYRIDGVLNTDITLPKSIHREVVSRIKIMSDMNVAEKRLPQDGRFTITSKDGKSLDLRISTFPTVYGEKVVLRLLEQEALKPKLEDLHLTPSQLELFKTKIHSSYGLVLITGPTGSGKTTTLYSALSTVDKDKLNVVTLENPVEYRLDGINQMQTNETIGLTFASGLRTILRQDPDVIMLGEIRDLGTAQMAIRASLTGHMVFSTLHTNDAIGVVIRLVTMGIDAYLVASSVTLVVAQRLVRTVCPHCTTAQTLDQLKKDLNRKGITTRKLESFGFDLEIMPDFAYGKGCSYCRGSGYLGRQAIFEFFEFNDEIVAEILKPNIDELKIRELAKEAKMKTLAQNAWDLVVDGTTTIEEIIRVMGE
jgi:type IV pilus assembly protein PilB